MDLDLTPATELFSKSKLIMKPQIQVGKKLVSTDTIVNALEPLLTDERIQKLKKVVSHRNPNVVTVLENIYDRGNISAVMRTGEALGFYRFSIIEGEKARFKAANRVTRGAEKWLDVDVHAKADAAVDALKAENFVLLGTDLQATHSFDQIEFDKPIAIVIGNEKDGISEEMRSKVDQTVKLPMVGFSQSFNLSVATALVLHQVFQRSRHCPINAEQSQQLYANYLLRCVEGPERFF